MQRRKGFLPASSAGLASPIILVRVGWALAHLQDRITSLGFAPFVNDSDGGLKPTIPCSFAGPMNGLCASALFSGMGAGSA